MLVDDVPDEDADETAMILDACPLNASRIVTTRSLNVASASGKLGCLAYQLGDFSDTDALDFLANRFAGKTGAAPTSDVLRDLVRTVGGHPLSLETHTTGLFAAELTDSFVARFQLERVPDH